MKLCTHNGTKLKWGYVYNSMSTTACPNCVAVSMPGCLAGNSLAVEDDMMLQLLKCWVQNKWNTSVLSLRSRIWCGCITRTGIPPPTQTWTLTLFRAGWHTALLHPTRLGTMSNCDPVHMQSWKWITVRIEKISLPTTISCFWIRLWLCASTEITSFQHHSNQTDQNRNWQACCCKPWSRNDMTWQHNGKTLLAMRFDDLNSAAWLSLLQNLIIPKITEIADFQWAISSISQMWANAASDGKAYIWENPCRRFEHVCTYVGQGSQKFNLFQATSQQQEKIYPVWGRSCK